MDTQLLAKTAYPGKFWFLRYRAKGAKVGGAVEGVMGSKIYVLQYIFNLVH